MVKIVIFMVIVLSIVIFPFFNTNYKVSYIKTNKNKYVPTVIKNGTYFVYNKQLIKKGSFSVLNIYSKNQMDAYNFVLVDFLRNFVLKSDKVLYQHQKLIANNLYYQTDDYNLTTVSAVYNLKTKILNGNEFKIFGLSYKGFGKDFEIKDNNIYADNIKYFIRIKE